MKNQPLCTPCLFYIIWTIISICFILYNSMVIESRDHFGNLMVYLGTTVIVLSKLILAVLLCSAMSYLCDSGRQQWSWFIIVSLVIIYLIMAYSINNKVELMKQISNSGM